MKCVSEDPLYITGGELEYPRELFLRIEILKRTKVILSLILVQITYLIGSLTLDSANSCVIQGASCTQRKVTVVSFGSISSNSFLPSILLLVVIMVTVVVVVVTIILYLPWLQLVLLKQQQYYQQLIVRWQLESWLVLRMYGYNRKNDSIGGLVFLVTKIEENRMYGSGVIDLTGDKDPTDKDGDAEMDDSTGVLASLGGEISPRGRNS
nr:hypothetical protein [Tanacetum cinerariifolium]